MSWGTLTVGALTLKEAHNITDATNAQSGDRTVTLAGVETSPALTLEQLRALIEDLPALFGKVVPITFSRKVERNGFYLIDDVNTSAIHWEGEASAFNWSMGLTRVGPENAVDIESRLVNVVRANDFSLTGTRWHSPSIGSKGYFTGSTVAPGIFRFGEDGTHQIFIGIPANTNPRWGVPTAAYANGRCRFIRNGVERAGERIQITGTVDANWEINNGLVKVEPGVQGLKVSVWCNGSWAARDWGVFYSSGDLVAPYHSMTVLRNDFEQITVRLMKDVQTGGRALLDLTVRRGAPFVECLLQRSTAADELKARLNTAESFDYTVPGLGFAKGLGSDGIAPWIATPRTFVTHNNGGIAKPAVTELAFAIGAEVPGTQILPSGSQNDGFELGSTAGWLEAGTPDARLKISEAANLTDLFDRTLPSSWGGSGSGLWTANAGANVTPSVDGARAVMTHSAAGTTREMILLALGRDDVDITITDLQFNRAVTGDNPEFTVAAKISGSGADRVKGRVFWTTANAITCNITENVANATTATTGFPGVASATNSTPVNVRFRVDRKYYKLKVWRTVDPEPSAWTVTLTGTAVLAAGNVSVNTNVPATYTGTLSAAFSFADFTQPADPVKFGSFSGKLISEGIGLPRLDGPTRPAVGSKSYTVYGWLYAPVSLSGNARLGIHWYGPGGFISSSIVDSSITPGLWTPYKAVGISPAATTSMAPHFGLPSSAAGEILRGDGFRIHETLGSGQSAQDLRDQYIAASSERTAVVPR